LNRNVTVLAASLFALSIGEELWQAYLPAYLAALGAGGAAVGAFGSVKDLLDSAYQYPGGWLSDRLGRRRALLTFTGLATAGYAVYAGTAAWPWMFAGLVAVMAWKAAAFPTTFAVIGDALPRERRSTAFAVQSVLVRVPRVISAPLGGMVVAALGIVAGLRTCFAVTVAIGLAVLLVQYRFFHDPAQNVAAKATQRAPLPGELRRLLVADCLVRIGEGLAASFIVLFVTQVAGVPVARYGLFYAVQQAVAIVAYLPGAGMAAHTGRSPLVACTFLFFAAFPLAVRLASSDAALLVAFVIGGLKELGEPARKSLIVDLSPDDRIASTVGTYYAIRNFLVVPAGVAGGLLWQVRPELPLEAAAAVSALGFIVFLVTSRKLP
jgi:predicted MFS family arabinose efflux permease